MDKFQDIIDSLANAIAFSEGGLEDAINQLRNIPEVIETGKLDGVLEDAWRKAKALFEAAA